MARPLRLFIALFLVVGSASRAGADDTHYNGIPLGAHSIALGGAFTGVADDASAAYFNPAGLVLASQFSLAGGLTLRAFEWQKETNSLGTDDGNATFANNGSRGVPLFIGAVAKFGKKDAQGRKRYAIGYSTFQPLFSGFGAEALYADGDTTDTFSLSTSDRANYVGLSFAALLSLRSALGVSTFLSIRKQFHREISFGSAVNPDTGRVRTASTETRGDLKAYHMVLRLGWLQQVRDNVSVGIMLQPPGIPLSQKADLRLQSIFTDSEATPVEGFEFLDQETSADAPIPLELTVGVGYRLNDRILLSLDASFYSPTPDRARVKVPSGEGTLLTGVFYENSTKRRAIGNFAIGGDFNLTDKVVLELGFFSDFSAAPNIPDNPTRFYTPQINRLGATVSVAFDFIGGWLAIGATYVGGKGDSTGAFLDVMNQALGYDKTTASSNILYVHVTGASQAATRTGDATQHWLEKKKNKKDKPEEAPEEAKDKGDEESTDASSTAQ